MRARSMLMRASTETGANQAATDALIEAGNRGPGIALCQIALSEQSRVANRALSVVS